jgi:SPP1 family predicted phage head-tail adaptor
MMTNAGRYDKRIRIVKDVQTTDKDGFPTSTRETILEAYATVKTTSGFTLIQNDSDFEKALTNFTIRYPGTVAIDRDMLIEYNGKTYTIQYLNNVNEAGIELEIQAKVVMH